MLDPLTIAASGFGLGLVHTLEPDHLAAISTLVGRGVPGQTRAELAKAAAWAIGHAIALGAFCALVLFLATRQVSVVGARPTAALVGLVLVYLGVVRLREAWRGGGHAHAHVLHDHALHARDEAGRQRGALALGVFHGLADSSAILILMPALVTGEATSYVLYIIAFGLGSVVSMGSFCWLLARFSDEVRARSRRAGPWLSIATGSLCLVAGTFWLGTALRG